MAISSADIATLSRLLDDALELEASRQTAWLDALAPEHRRHAAQLREMLAAHVDSNHDERLSTLPKLAPDEVVAHAGERVGSYRLIREIGRGGMGAVWLAERADGNFKREVALKLPHLAWGTGLAERMARERDIGALLEHPHIARLYDAGLDARGRPFIAMEFIDGQSIDTWCHECGLDVQGRLRLFVQVVRAVAYAHGRLVIHRDLKPANVLVDAEGQVHLLDFGIAKLIEETPVGPSLTQQQGRMLTPLYASPEHIEGKPVGVAADVYSLGVVLYELLTGALPHAPKRSSLGALEEAILLGDAPPASSRVSDRATQRALRGDVDAILAKAMKREPLERYASADALAEDIERHLSGDTVKAQPDSTGYRLRKAIVRHRFGFAATAAILVAVFAGGAAALIQAHRAAQQAERARVATEFVSEVFRVSARGASSEERRGGGAEPMLDRSARLIEARFAGQPDTQAELYGVVGRIYADIGAGQMAIDYANRQIKLLDLLPADRERRIKALLQLAEACSGDGRYEDARRHVVRAIEFAAPDSEMWAEAQALLARVELDLGHKSAAQKAARDAEMAVEAHRGKPSVAAARLLEVQGELLDDFDRALPMYQRAIDIAVQVEGAQSHTGVSLRRDVAERLISRNRGIESRPYIDAALSSLRASGGAGEIQAAVLSTWYWDFMYEMGAAPYAEAAEEIERSRSFLAAQPAPIPAIVLARVDFNSAMMRIVRGDLSGGRRLLGASAPILKQASSQDWSARAIVILYEGVLAMELGQHAQADSLLREYLSLMQKGRVGSPAFAAYDWGWVALNLIMQGDYERAQQFLESTPKFGAMKGDPRDDGGYARALPALLARVLLERNDIRGALSAMPSLPADFTDSEPLFVQRALSGEILCAAGRAAEGLPELLDSIRTVSVKVGENHPGLARIRAAAGLCALALGEAGQAASLAEQARQAFIAQPDVSPYFKAPLAKLEHALRTRRPAKRAARMSMSGFSSAPRPIKGRRLNRNRLEPDVADHDPTPHPHPPRCAGRCHGVDGLDPRQPARPGRALQRPGRRFDGRQQGGAAGAGHRWSQAATPAQLKPIELYVIHDITKARLASSMR